MNNPIMHQQMYKKLSTLAIDIYQQEKIALIRDKTVAKLVTQFLEEGFVIIQNAISQEIIERLKNKISTGFKNKAYCSYWDEDSQKKFGLFKEDLINKGELKILDAHFFDQDVQDAIFSPLILSVLKNIFGTDPLAFQSLGFIKGSGQPIHDDRSFVKVNPLGNFMASWIALENVEEGNGELFYYPKSHLLPPHQFRDNSFWNFQEDEIKNYSNTLITKAEKAGLKLEKFYPQKGDVLLWHSGLLHGGSPIINENATRYSVVTHYCPIFSRPPYLEHKLTKSVVSKFKFWPFNTINNPEIVEIKRKFQTIGFVSSGFKEIKP